jgi:hypothetical protein
VTGEEAGTFHTPVQGVEAGGVAAGIEPETRRWSLSAPAPALRLREGGLHHLREGGLGSRTAFEEVRLLNGLERNNQPLASVVLHVRVRRAAGVSFFAGHSGLTFIVEVGALRSFGIRSIC